jgi:hypothetical protein
MLKAYLHPKLVTKQAHTFEIRTKVEPSKEGVRKNLFLCFVLLLLWFPECSYQLLFIASPHICLLCLLF